MLDINSNNNYSNTQKVEIKPPCIGTLQKSHHKSFFVICHVKSHYKDNYIDEKPNVLQIMVFGENYMIAEILPEQEYQEWINQQNI